MLGNLYVIGTYSFESLHGALYWKILGAQTLSVKFSV